jgi:chromosome segregation ATPase
MEEIKAKHSFETKSLEGERTNLHSKVDQYVVQLERQEEASRVTQAEFEKRLSEQEMNHRASIQIEEQKILEAQEELKKLGESFENLKQQAVEKNEQLSREVTLKNQQITHMDEEITKRDMEIEALKKNGEGLQALQNERDELRNRSKRLSTRYAEGDLVSFFSRVGHLVFIETLE